VEEARDTGEEYLKGAVRRWRKGIKRSRKIKKLDCGLDDRGIGVQFSAGARYFYLPHSVSRAHAASYAMATGVKAAGT
jgi:hypothetical protein